MKADKKEKKQIGIWFDTENSRLDKGKTFKGHIVELDSDLRIRNARDNQYEDLEVRVFEWEDNRFGTDVSYYPYAVDCATAVRMAKFLKACDRKQRQLGERLGYPARDDVMGRLARLMAAIGVQKVIEFKEHRSTYDESEYRVYDMSVGLAYLTTMILPKVEEAKTE